MTRRTRWIVAASLLAVGAAALFLGVTSVQDALHLTRLRQQVERAAAEGDPSVIRAALLDLAALEAQPAWRHPWLHTLGQRARQQTLHAIEGALLQAEGLAGKRSTNHAWLAALSDRVVQALTLPQLHAAGQELMRGAPHADAPLPVGAIAEVQALVDRREAEFLEDDRRNAQALAAAQAQLEAAGEDPAALLPLLEAVFPRPDRNPQTHGAALAHLHQEARTRYARAVAARLHELEERAQQAISSAQVRVVLVALDRDPDLRRHTDGLAQMNVVRRQILQRAEALEAWERLRTTMETRLQDGDPIGAAHALIQLRPPDAPRERELQELRDGFGSRCAYVAAQQLVKHAEARDWEGAHRLIAGLQEDGLLQALLDDTARATLAQSARALVRTEDRVRYEELRANPCAPLVERYLEGWPGVPRRMAAEVQAYQAWLAHPVTEALMEAVEWQTVTPAQAIIEETPDATFEFRVNGQSGAITRIEDIRSHTRSTLVEPVRIMLARGHDEPVTLEAIVHIDLRDEPINDPVARGQVTIYPADLRAAGTLVLQVRDQAWFPRPHRIILRGRGVGAPVLPPWDAPPVQTAP